METMDIAGNEIRIDKIIGVGPVKEYLVGQSNYEFKYGFDVFVEGGLIPVPIERQGSYGDLEKQDTYRQRLEQVRSDFIARWKSLQRPVPTE